MISNQRDFQVFRFSVDNQREEPTFFSNLFESYKDRYDRYRSMIENAEFHPVQDFRNILAEKAHQAEESAQIVYETFIQPGSSMDKHLSALSQATSSQLSEAWNSVKGMKERLETANFLSERRNALMEQLRGNRAMLNRMREMPYAVPSGQMAALMRKVTESYDALTQLEQRATHAFVNATGALADRGQALFPQKEPQRYAKYSADPLLQVGTLLCILFLVSSKPIFLIDGFFLSYNGQPTSMPTHELHAPPTNDKQDRNLPAGISFVRTAGVGDSTTDNAEESRFPKTTCGTSGILSFRRGTR